jgi:hypothetical protein
VLLTLPQDCRNLPKLAWVFIVLLFPDIGSIAWLVAGKNWNKFASKVPSSPVSAQFPEYDRPGRHVPTNPDDDAEFLASLRKRAEDQRRRAKEEEKAKDGDGTDTGTPAT